MNYSSIISRWSIIIFISIWFLFSLRVVFGSLLFWSRVFGRYVSDLFLWDFSDRTLFFIFFYDWFVWYWGG